MNSVDHLRDASQLAEGKLASRQGRREGVARTVRCRFPCKETWREMGRMRRFHNNDDNEYFDILSAT